MSQTSGQSSSCVYQSCDPAYLRQLREAARMDLTMLAKTACLSVAQVRELEQGSETGVFYSVSIRRQAYKRLLMILGAEPPMATPMDVATPEQQAHQTQLQSLDQIVAMSRLPAMVQSPWAPLQAVAQRALEHKQALGAGVLLVLAAALLVLNWPHGRTAAQVSHAVQGASSATVAASEAVVTESVPSKSSVSEHSAPASAPSAPVMAASVPAVTASASSPVMSAPASTVASTAAAMSCAFTAEALPQISPTVASKPGRYVHFVSTANVEMCVVDGSKQVTILTLKAGENRSVYGSAPWQVSSVNLNKVQIFFQGWRVALPSESTQRMTLVEKTTTP